MFKEFLLAALATRCHALRIKVGHIRDDSSTPIIWIKGFGRTLSTTTQQVISASLPENQLSLFEPCTHDYYDGEPVKHNNQIQCMKDAMACDFSRISHEWETCFNNGCCHVTDQTLDKKCGESAYRLFKTINPDLKETLSLLEANDLLQVLHVERDPRSVYTSQQVNWKNGWHDVSLLLKYCKQAAENIKISHPRLHKVKFHELVSDPFNSFESLLNKLGLAPTKPIEGFHSTKFQQCKLHRKESWNL